MATPGAVRTTGGETAADMSPRYGRPAAATSGAGRVFASCAGTAASSPVLRGEDALRADEPGLVGDDDGLDAVAEPELAQDARDVRLDRRLAEDEALGELRVRQ